MKLHHDILGDHGPAVVLLHGLLGDGGNLRRLALAVGEGRRLLLPDLRNHGRSPHQAGMDWAALAADVVETAQAAGMTRFHLLGHSLGGKVAMRVAADFPDAVRSLAVLDIAPVAYPPHHRRILQALLALQDDPPASRDEAQQRLQAALPGLAGETAFLLKNLQRVAGGRLGFRCDLGAIQAAYDGLRESSLQAGQGYAGPVLFLRGERSSYIDAAGEAAIHARYPQARLRALADAGHWLHVEQTAAVAAALLPFWDQAGD